MSDETLADPAEVADDDCLFAVPPVPPVVRSRRADPIFDAIAEVCGIDPRLVAAKGVASRLGRVKRELLDMVKAQDLPTDPERVARGIRTRAQRYRERWPRMSLTPEALAKHWPELGPPVAVTTQHPDLIADEIRRMNLYA